MSETEKTEKPSWVKTRPEELSKIVVSLAKEGKSPAEIGLILRDSHGIPRSKLIGKKVSQMLKESKAKFISEQEIVKAKLDNLKSHMEKNKHDKKAKKSHTKHSWVLHKFELKAK